MLACKTIGGVPAGGVLEYVAYEFNLMHLSNATAMWMGINPPDIFLYVFLPPLLLDSAIRIDFFTFRKVLQPELADMCLDAVCSGAVCMLLYHRCHRVACPCIAF